MLLRPRNKETHEALPRLAFPLIFGWLGYLWLAPLVEQGLGNLWPLLPAAMGQVGNLPAWGSCHLRRNSGGLPRRRRC